MKLFNTLTRQIEDFTPIASSPSSTSSTPSTSPTSPTPSVGLYSCGITAYDYAHLGNLRRYALDDILVRSLSRSGYQVNYIQNVTDIGHLVSDEDEGEDKVETAAKKLGKTPAEIAKVFEAYFYEMCDKMYYVAPTKIVLASEHIPEQIALIQKLEAQGYTYIIESDGVYYDTSKFPDYGYLARLDIKNLQAGARVAPVAGKKNPTDFALWKFERPGENRLQVWSSPWAERGFPGWHTECVAMSTKYLGNQYDLHTGGIDHIPVHHTNEIAQAEAAAGQKPYVKYWLHANFLRINGEKMAKSKGNFYKLDDVLERGFSTGALKYLFLTTHYRNELNFTWENLAGVQKLYDRLVNDLITFKNYTGRNDFYNVVDDRMDALRQKFYEPINNDLNTGQALPILTQVVKSAVPSTDKYDLILEFDDVLGLGLRQAVAQKEQSNDQDATTTAEELIVEPAVMALLDDRAAAKKAGDYNRADQVRSDLLAQGLKIVDLPSGEQKLERV